MPSKKKNPPVPRRLSRKQQDSNMQFLIRMAVSTLASGTLIALLFAIYAASSPDAQIPAQDLLTYLPPFAGIVAAVTARPVKRYLQTSSSDLIHALVLAILLTLLIAGLILLLA